MHTNSKLTVEYFSIYRINLVEIHFNSPVPEIFQRCGQIGQLNITKTKSHTLSIRNLL